MTPTRWSTSTVDSFETNAGSNTGCGRSRIPIVSSERHGPLVNDRVLVTDGFDGGADPFAVDDATVGVLGRNQVRGRFEAALNSRGLLGRFLGRLTRSITRPGQMYPVGLLFGLGFDTATEIALLVLAGTGAASGLPWYAVLILPLLFAAGMSLLDRRPQPRQRRIHHRLPVHRGLAVAIGYWRISPGRGPLAATSHRHNPITPTPRT
jgi:hypothetical protein